MRPLSSRIKILAIAASVALGFVGFLFFSRGGDGGAQAHRDRPQNRGGVGASGIRQLNSNLNAISSADLVAPGVGWALTTSRLVWTTDGGRAWSNITPPGVGAKSIWAVLFDRSGHGVVVACREANRIPAPLMIFRTADDGRTWRVSTIKGERPGSIGSVHVSETRGIWWVLVDEAGIDLAGTRLYESRDAGGLWQARPRPPAAGRLTFLSKNDGWIVGGERSQLIYRTNDAGAKWDVPKVPAPGPLEPGEEVPLQREITHPPESEKEVPPPEGPVPVPGGGSHRRIVEYGLPERGLGGVLLPVTITSPAGRSEVLLYEFSDGRIAKLVSETKLAGSVGESEVTTTFMAPDELLIQDRGAGSGPPALIKVRTRSSGPGSSPHGARTTKIGRALGLPEPLPLHFVDRSDAVAAQNICPPGGCSKDGGLYFTTDGGRNWSPSPARP
jgi:photosystem II stability/assembly factor-like uncharacterized protein